MNFSWKCKEKISNVKNTPLSTNIWYVHNFCIFYYISTYIRIFVNLKICTYVHLGKYTKWISKTGNPYSCNRNYRHIHIYYNESLLFGTQKNQEYLQNKVMFWTIKRRWGNNTAFTAPPSVGAVKSINFVFFYYFNVWVRTYPFVISHNYK